MPLHEFKPGKLVAGLAVLGAATVFAGDAGGWWDAPWFVMVPIICGGLCLASAVSLVDYRIRRRRSARAASRESTEAPASTSGSQAMR
ncbi:hypothetical protein SSPS47_21310 [Streptomyces sp. S4.7]|uniref:hypothetical protein n=1 Tax=unclassified Streptomyces TaxID=2593676 RepID=UPI0011C9B894|nr:MULTISPECIES: hypothetical protein [unclassified Streptomyces]QHY97647.1 hypothetical protein SSPS47_21310 [Streptomyces sp. S4.7]TXL90256.1 hypothetical protein EW053_10430 [Streptomyces sp. IB2014 016-6]